MHSNSSSFCLNNVFIFIFCKPCKHQTKKKKKRKERTSTALGMLDSDSPCVCLCFLSFFNFGHSKQREFEFILHRALCTAERARQGRLGSPALSHSVTGQLLPSSEVVNEHRHTVCTHQVVWVSRERFVLPSFGITIRGH